MESRKQRHGRPATWRSQESLEIEKFSRSIWYGFRNCVAYEKNTPHLESGKRFESVQRWFDLWLRPVVIPKSTQQAARSSPIRDTWNVPCIFAVWSYMFKKRSFKVNSFLNILFIILFLSVFYSITFGLRNTDPTQRKWICSLADKQLKFILNLGLSLYSYAVCFCHRSGPICKYF